MEYTKNSDYFATVPDGVGDAVGVAKELWIVAIGHDIIENVDCESPDNQDIEMCISTQKRFASGRVANA